MPCPSRTGLQFHHQRKSGEGRRPPLSFLSRRHASIIGSASRLSRGVFLSLHGQARSTNYQFSCVERARPRAHELTELPGRKWASATVFYCVRACPGLLQNVFVAKPACLVLRLSNPAFSVIINLQGSLKFPIYTSLVGVTI